MNPNTLERLVEHPKKVALPNFWHVHQPILAHTRRRNSKLVRPVGNFMRSYRKLFDVVCTSLRGNGWLKYHITDRIEQFSALEKTEWPDSNYWALPSWKWCINDAYVSSGEMVVTYKIDVRSSGRAHGFGASLSLRNIRRVSEPFSAMVRRIGRRLMSLTAHLCGTYSFIDDCNPVNKANYCRFDPKKSRCEIRKIVANLSPDSSDQLLPSWAFQFWHLRSKLCFSDAILPGDRKMIFFDGQMMNVGLWEHLEMASCLGELRWVCLKIGYPNEIAI